MNLLIFSLILAFVPVGPGFRSPAFMARVTPDAAPPSGPSLQYYVNPFYTGTETGSESQPFNTLTEARDALRVATNRTSDGVGTPTGSWSNGAEIILLGGTHYLSTPLSLDERDQGTSSYRVVWKSQTGNRATISATKDVSSNWQVVTQTNDSWAWNRLPVAARSKVYRISFSTLGIPAGAATGGYNSSWEVPTLTQNGTVVKPSAWPNGNLYDLTGSSEIIGGYDGRSVGQPSWMTVNSAAPLSWYNSTSNIRIWGYFLSSYWSMWHQISGITNDGGNARISFTWTSPINANPGLPLAAGRSWQRAILFNGLPFMTENSHVWNWSRGYLYWWPTGGAPSGVTKISQNNRALSVGEYVNWPYNYDPAQGTDYITFDNITFEGGRGEQVVVSGSSYVTFNNCKFSGCFGYGLDFYGGDGQIVNSCQFYDFGTSSLRMMGTGSVETLSGNWAITNNVFDGQQWNAVEAIWDMVHLLELPPQHATRPNYYCSGGIVSGNIFRNSNSASLAPYSLATTVSGNTFENFSRVRADGGAIYMLAPPPFCGLIVENNMFRDAVKHPMMANDALYSDYYDERTMFCISRNNTYVNVENGTLANGGGWMVVDGNTYTNLSGAPIISTDRSYLFNGRNPALNWSFIESGNWVDTNYLENTVGLSASQAAEFVTITQYRAGGAKEQTWAVPKGWEIVNNTFNDAGEKLFRVDASLGTYAPGPGSDTFTASVSVGDTVYKGDLIGNYATGGPAYAYHWSPEVVWGKVTRIYNGVVPANYQAVEVLPESFYSLDQLNFPNGGGPVANVPLRDLTDPQ